MPKEIKEKKRIGAPRKHNREQIALDLVEWAKLDDSINVNKFCAYYEPPFPVDNLSDWAKFDKAFRRSYDTAKTFIAFRREEWVSKGKLHVKPYDLAAPAYDKVIKREKRENAKFESKIKQKEENKVPDIIVTKFDNLMSQISSVQSDLKTASNNNKTDRKS